MRTILSLLLLALVSSSIFMVFLLPLIGFALIGFTFDFDDEVTPPSGTLAYNVHVPVDFLANEVTPLGGTFTYDVQVPVDFFANEVTPSSGTFTFVNNTDREFMHGFCFRLEQKLDEVWVPIIGVEPYIIRERGFPIRPMQSTGAYIKWENSHGILDSGLYRIVKSLSCTNTARIRAGLIIVSTPEEFFRPVNHYVYAEFEIIDHITPPRLDMGVFYITEYETSRVLRKGQ